MSLISVQSLSRDFGANRVVDDVSFSLAAGEILGFLGPNGAGKSTTMQMISGNLAPSEGIIHIDGIDLLDQPIRAKSVIGYLPDQPPVYRELTVDEYLQYCARLRGLRGNDRNVAISTTVSRCGLTSVRSRLIANLSKGYQQRVGIAQAILHRPRVIILDEPTVGLDPNQMREIRDLITELGEHHGIILSTHILPEVQAVCNKVIIIDDGHIAYQADMSKYLYEKHTGSYEVAFARPPASDDQLYQIAGVNSVDKDASGNYLVHTTGSAEDISNAAAANNWGLTCLIPHERTLEQIFIDITLGADQSEQEA